LSFIGVLLGIKQQTLLVNTVKRGDTLSVTGSIESKLIEAGNDKKYTQVTVIVNSVKMLR